MAGQDLQNSGDSESAPISGRDLVTAIGTLALNQGLAHGGIAVLNGGQQLLNMPAVAAPASTSAAPPAQRQP